MFSECGERLLEIDYPTAEGLFFLTETPRDFGHGKGAKLRHEDPGEYHATDIEALARLAWWLISPFPQLPLALATKLQGGFFRGAFFDFSVESDFSVERDFGVLKFAG